MQYGVPYQGSKSSIARQLIAEMPSADVFVDLFAGGCAMTHAALLSGKYKRVIANDIGDAPQLFLDAVNGKYKNEARWISRADFFRLKDKDPYVRWCWSFSNNGQTYLFSAENASLAERGALPKDVVKSSLNRLNECMRVKPFADKIVVSNRDYRAVALPKNAVIYTDIPYKTTDGEYRKSYGVRFDWDAFYDWAERQTAPLFISEYSMPPGRFKRVFAIKKRNLGAGAKTKSKTVEGLWIPRSQEAAHKPTTLFDCWDIAV